MGGSQSIPRRAFLAAATGLTARVALGPVTAAAQGGPAFDLLVRGGQVVDPSQGLHGGYDVGILGGKITQVAPALDAATAREVIEADGRIVTPGFIDLHVHVYLGVSHYGIDADTHCVARGVTTAVDAGSARLMPMRVWDVPPPPLASPSCTASSSGVSSDPPAPLAGRVGFALRSAS